MAASMPLYTTAHLVGHLLREIEGAVIDVLYQGDEIRSRDDKLQAVRRSLGIDESDGIPSAWLKDEFKYVEAVNDIAGATLDVVEQGARSRKIRAIAQNLGIKDGDQITKEWLQLELHRIAHRVSLAQARPFDQEFNDLWRKAEGILDVVLAKFEEHYLDYFRLLDILLGKESPTNEDLRTLQHRVPNNELAREYFFTRLNYVNWLPMLWRRGFFSSPPAPQYTDDDHIRFPVWPESGYLARMASKMPEVVKDIFLEMPETQNVYVHENIAEAACAMPANSAAPLAEKEMKWISDQTFLYGRLPEIYAELANHLLVNGQIEVGFGLSQLLLSIQPAPDIEGEDEDGD